MESLSSKTRIGVIGGGAAGTMATLRGVLNNDHVLLFEGNRKNKKKSRDFWVRKIENIPGYFHFKKGIVDPNKETYQFMQESHFKDKFDYLKNTSVTKIEKKGEGFILTDDKENKHEVNYVILTTGLMDVQPEIAESIQPILPFANVQIADYCIRCDGHHVFGKDLVVIGHSNIAAWVSIILKERYEVENVTLLANGHPFEVQEDTQELLDMYKIKKLEAKITEVQGVPKEKLLEGFVLESGEKVQAGFAFISLGMMVYNELAVQLGTDVDERGFVTTNTKGETSIPNFYVAGDLRANTKKQIYTAWDTAVDSMDDINNKIRRQQRAEKLEQFRNNQ
ncbi:NAD(P)/FAD-dependent oxidoreductase [Bacteriovoracaceae bacterium]|nr:NAD(P)/FAD-dependent oxidoreductase [Bacteriovoracaceae bacterium]